jgi:YgiT-type zinc finger domain-containing protein
VKPTICSFCEGNLKSGKTEFVARVENEVIVVKEVPAYVCEQCGEAYYTPEISRKLDEVMREFHRGKLLMRPLAAGEIELKLEA